MNDETIRALLVAGHCVDGDLRREVTDAQWADFGRTVAGYIFDDDAFKRVLVTAPLKSKNTIEFLGHVRAYILTGTKM